MDKYILAFDIGTTAIKAGIINLVNFEIVALEKRENKVLLPAEGWAEQEAEELWDAVTELSQNLTNKWKISGIVYATQMAGVLPLDKSGNPLRNFIIWLDERGKGYPKELWKGVFKVKGYNLLRLIKFLYISGGAPSTTGKDPISKILWLRENEPEVYRKTWKFVDVKSYLLFKTTGNIVTSPDEANLTWLVDTRKGRAIWHEKLLQQYGIDPQVLPPIKTSIELAGHVTSSSARELGVNPGTPVFVGSGDMVATAIGSGAVNTSEIHIYIGTSDWIATHIDKRKLDLFHHVGSILSAIPGLYLLVAEQEIAGSALDKIMTLLGMSKYEELEKVVSTVEPGAGGMLFFPWLYGERAPIDDPFVRGGIFNLSLRSGKGEILRAVMEGVAFNIKWAYQYIERLAGYNKEVRIVGGAALSNTWCQILADVLRRKVIRMAQPRYAVLIGAAVIGSIGLGLYSSFTDATKRLRIDKIFTPTQNLEIYNKLFKEFIKIYNNLKNTYRRLNEQKLIK
ncbi:FGGY-family carbohydrate kinase [Pyrobaculum aerophilum]|uniref:xylulokinase n=1 Tax=Pyrobaculum aerophilum TaxID=13773 RepID=UPI002FD89102